jgi:hypothetical protein
MTLAIAPLAIALEDRNVCQLVSRLLRTSDFVDEFFDVLANGLCIRARWALSGESRASLEPHSCGRQVATDDPDVRPSPLHGTYPAISDGLRLGH